MCLSRIDFNDSPLLQAEYIQPLGLLREAVHATLPICHVNVPRKVFGFGQAAQQTPYDAFEVSRTTDELTTSTYHFPKLSMGAEDELLIVEIERDKSGVHTVLKVYSFYRAQYVLLP